VNNQQEQSATRDDGRLASRIQAAKQLIGHSPRWTRERLVRLGRSMAEQPRKALVALGCVAGVLALAAGALVYLVEGNYADQQARTAALQVAQDRAISLLSYDYRTIDRQVANNDDALTGKFKDDYTTLVNKVIFAAVKAQQVTTQTQVVAQSVVSGNTHDVTVLLFLNQQSQMKGQAAPVLTGSRLRVTLENNDNKWQISDLTPV
jgi:Mce-associated membrane protein